MKTRIGVKVMPRDVILDTQGRAIEHTLELNQLPVQACRVGRYVELEFAANKDESLQQAEKIANFVLHNPLIEKFELQVL